MIPRVFRTLALGVGTAALCLPALAMADDDLSKGLAGNTVVTEMGGMSFKTYYNDDGTFESDLGSYGKSSGTWEIKDGQLCSTSESGPQPGTQCNPFEAHKVGDKWDVDGPMGPMTMSLVKGKDF